MFRRIHDYLIRGPCNRRWLCRWDHDHHTHTFLGLFASSEKSRVLFRLARIVSFVPALLTVTLVAVLLGWVTAGQAQASSHPPCESGVSTVKGGWSSRTGRDVPIVLVHGKSGTPDMWTQTMEWTNGLSTERLSVVRDSYVEAISRLHGAVVYVFDYEHASEKWVDHPDTGGKLGTLVDCLYDAYKTQVVVVGHSMGALVANYVAKQNQHNKEHPKIGLIISLNTPYQGSFAATRVFPQPLEWIIDNKSNRLTPAGRALRAEATNTPLANLSGGQWAGDVLLGSTWSAQRYTIATSVRLHYTDRRPILSPVPLVSTLPPVLSRRKTANIGDGIVSVFSATDGWVVGSASLGNGLIGFPKGDDHHVEECVVYDYSFNIGSATDEVGNPERISNTRYGAFIGNPPVGLGVAGNTACYHSNMYKVKSIRDVVVERINAYIDLSISEIIIKDADTRERLPVPPPQFIKSDSSGQAQPTYNITVPYSTSTIEISATRKGLGPVYGSTIEVVPQSKVELPVGHTIVTIRLKQKPPNARSKVYTISITRTAPGSYSSLVDAGHKHSCAVTDDLVRCWGDDTHRQVTKPFRLLGRYVAITTGLKHTCGLWVPDRVLGFLSSDTSPVVCWGNDQYGQANPPDGQYVEVSAGWWHTCGLKTDRTITCWGHNDCCQTKAPEGQFKTVSAGRNHSCAIRQSGTVVCWGNNEYGQTDPPPGQYDAVSAGWWHTCGLKTDQTITCWGDNRSDETDPPTGTFKDVSTGGAHSCAIKNDNTIVCWGNNEYGQTDPPPGQYDAVSAGWWHTCGLKTDQTITCWGDNTHGQANPSA